MVLFSLRSQFGPGPDDQLPGIRTLRYEHRQILFVASPNGELRITVFGKSKAYDELLKQNSKNANGHLEKLRK